MKRQKDLDDTIVNKLVYERVPSGNDCEYAEYGSLCAAKASLPGTEAKSKFDEYFAEIRNKWVHPVCRVIRNYVDNKTFWDSQRGGLEGTYQTTFVDPIIVGTLGEQSVFGA